MTPNIFCRYNSITKDVDFALLYENAEYHYPPNTRISDNANSVHMSNADIDAGKTREIDYRVESSIMKGFALHNEFWTLIYRTGFNYHIKDEIIKLNMLTAHAYHPVDLKEGSCSKENK